MLPLKAETKKTDFAIGVIVGLDLIGDALLKLPVVKALRALYPDACFHWITSKGTTAFNGPLRELTASLIDVIDEKPTWLKTKENLNPKGTPPSFKVLFDTRNRWREAVYAKESVPSEVFISPALRFLFSDRRPPFFFRKPQHMVDRMLQQIQLVAGELLPEVGMSLSVPVEFSSVAEQMLPEGLTYVGFAPGAGNKEKAWPLERFIAVACDQTAKGRIPVFLLGPDELDWHDELARAVPSAKFPLQDYESWDCSSIKLEQTLAIAQRLAVAVVNDSGTSHILAAVDCPLISLFGPTAPSKFMPKVSQSRTIRAQDFGSSAMSDIPIDRVVKAINLLITQQARANTP